MRSRAAMALAVVVVGACAADDKVLTPDVVDSGKDAASITDAGMFRDAATSGAGGNGGGYDASGGGGDAGGGANDASGGDSASSDGGVAPDAGPATQVAKDPDCDLNGVWIARQVTESLALGLTQYASNWYYLEFAQDGEQVVVSKHMDCGIEVHGSVDVALAPNTTRALLTRNRQVGRKGSFAKQADGRCAFQMEKFWSVRGVSEEKYAPTPRSRDVSIEQIKSENPLPTDAMAGAEDWDGDSHPGIAWEVSGILSGTRHSAQRDWTRWFSAPDYSVDVATNFTTDLMVRAEFSNEEIVYEVVAGDIFSQGSLGETSAPSFDAPHTLTLRFLGRTTDDPRAQTLLKADNFETCLAIQKALPAAFDRLK